MGLHASYYPIKPTTLTNFITHWHTDGVWKEVSKFIEESIKQGLEFYIGTTWLVLDFVINSPEARIFELAFAVVGINFPHLTVRLVLSHIYRLMRMNIGSYSLTLRWKNHE